MLCTHLARDSWGLRFLRLAGHWYKPDRQDGVPSQFVAMLAQQHQVLNPDRTIPLGACS